jgi:hypothetical protein
MTKHFDFHRPHLSLPSLRSRGDDVAVTRGSLELGAAGAIALGALAIGAMAIGAIAINRLVVRRARLDRLSVGRLDVGRLVVHERGEGADEEVDPVPQSSPTTG